MPEASQPGAESCDRAAASGPMAGGPMMRTRSLSTHLVAAPALVVRPRHQLQRRAFAFPPSASKRRHPTDDKRIRRPRFRRAPHLDEVRHRLRKRRLRLDDGRIGYRCASESPASYVKKGGDLAKTEGRKCLCNALLANIGLPQRRAGGYIEQPLLTAGDDLAAVTELLAEGQESYSAADVIQYLLSIP